MNSAKYSDLLVNTRKPTIRTKRRGLLSQKVLQLHDSAQTHTALITVKTMTKFDFYVLQHPDYSQDLAPSDFHIFGPLKNTSWWSISFR